MVDYNKNGGILWKNAKYEKGGNQPYAKGEITLLDGTIVHMTIWVPKSEKIKGFNVTISEPFKKENKNDSEEVEDLPF